MEKEEVLQKLYGIQTPSNEKWHASAWYRGVVGYAIKLLEEYEGEELSEEALLQGEPDWSSFSRDGNAFIYNEDIARRLLEQEELASVENGKKLLVPGKDWLDVQADALEEASLLIEELGLSLEEEKEL